MKTNIKVTALLLCTWLAVNSCKEQKTNDTESTPPPTEMDTAADEPALDENGDLILTGKTEPKAIRQAPYTRWFTPTYDEYSVDQETLAPVMNDLQKAKITVFMGTWCEDSQREVPSLFKILDEINYDYDQLTLITMTEDKETPQNLEKGKNITNVPTIIIHQEGEEINRIVEYPLESLEKDMAKILSGADYSHAYAEESED